MIEEATEEVATEIENREGINAFLYTILKASVLLRLLFYIMCYATFFVLTDFDTNRKVPIS